jgi:hypothetical protein
MNEEQGRGEEQRHGQEGKLHERPHKSQLYQASFLKSRPAYAILNTIKARFTYCSIYVLLIYILFFGTYYSKYILKIDIRILHLTYLNSIYLLSKVFILNTGVRISKYKGPIELHGDFGILVQQD